MTLYRLPDYVDHMLEAAELACSYIEGMPKEDFLDDKRTQQAVVLNLIVIGEVATKILKEARIYSAWRAITCIGRSAALVFLQISRYLLQKPPCIPSQPKRPDPRRINPHFLNPSFLLSS